MSSPQDWRSQITTPAQKKSYIENVLGITGGRKNREYTNAYNRLSDYVAGRIESPGPKYRAVETVAKATVEGRAVPITPRERREVQDRLLGGERRNAPPQTLYRVGDTITGTVNFRMREGNTSRDRTITGTWEITTDAAARLASHGQIERAILKEYFRGQDGQQATLNQYSGGGGRDFNTSGGGYGGGGGGGDSYGDEDDTDSGRHDSEDGEGDGTESEGLGLEEWEYDYGSYDDYDWRDDWGDDAEDYCEIT